MVELRQMKRVLAIMSICACLCGGAALADVQRSNRLVVDVYPFDSDKEWEAASDVALVADVEGVYFDSTENVNWSVNSRDMTLPEAVYRIELLVRKVEKGDFPYERVAFRLCMCIRGPLWTDWPFYRGITLGVSLRMVDGALRVRQVRPVLPYPPFSPCARAFRYSLRDVYGQECQEELPRLQVVARESACAWGRCGVCACRARRRSSAWSRSS